ncbi:MarR family winged helix-turn-helix transcriptional regulator [Terriglobus sp. TAA 43]|uniref:MarR family winged helix-turn-helix transcriptional regulator n=1 Tax=Terriglobus sp. TAA 43 TaxID=278961 RepID=UPI00068ACE21|nr:MarR family transcriptional regulator [Terriglobus sp. TAA 43]
MVSMESEASQIDSVPGLESHLGFWLRRVSNAVSAGFSRALGEQQTSVAEWVVLRELYSRGEAAPAELADALGLTRGAVSKIVDKLEAKKWIRVEANRADGRFRLLSVTQAGKRNLPVLAELADQNEAQFFDCLTENEREVLLQVLVKLAQQNQIRDVPTE